MEGGGVRTGEDGLRGLGVAGGKLQRDELKQTPRENLRKRVQIIFPLLFLFFFFCVFFFSPLLLLLSLFLTHSAAVFITHDKW